MAFLLAASSSLGKKLLLFGLRHIDILDKDPADFKLVSLLRLKLPREIHLSKAQASLLRVTFILDFGVPQILIEVDGVQVHARLSENSELAEAKVPSQDGKPSEARTQRPSPPRRRRPSSPSPFEDYSSDTSSEADVKPLLTVDDLAKSFIRDEPAEEIRELEEALNTQSEHLQESIASSDDGDDESTTGMGAPLALPAVLRNLLNTALDRLQITANHIDIEVEDQSPSDGSNESNEDEDPFASINFHIDRIAIDSVTSRDPQVDIASAALPSGNPDSKLGKRRMRVENVYARLISDADNFETLSRISRPSSPADTRSELSSSQKIPSDASTSQVSAGHDNPSTLPEEDTHPVQAFVPDIPHETEFVSLPPRHDNANRLSSSILTTDDDRFADAASDDSLEHSIASDLPTQPQHPNAPCDAGADSILYNVDGLLEYSSDNNLFDSTLGGSTQGIGPFRHPGRWGGDGANLSHDFRPGSPDTLPLVLGSSSSHTLQRSLRSVNGEDSLSQPALSELDASTDNLDFARHHMQPEQNTSLGMHSDSAPGEEDLAESKLFTHDDAESMYMSALSAAPLASSSLSVPGGWESSSSSSQDTGSDTSVPIPPAMVASSILRPLLEADDGCETPRPGSRQSQLSSPVDYRGRSPSQNIEPSLPNARSGEKLAKLFLTIDQISVWFPLGLEQNEPSEDAAGQIRDDRGLDFAPPNLGEDSIFQDMPGSFSNYALSTASRIPEAPKKRPVSELALAEKHSITPKKEPSPMISVEVGSLVGHMDISTGRIMFQMLDRILKALTGMSDTDTRPAMKKDAPVSPRAKLDLSIKHFSIAWLERLVTEPLLENGRSLSRLENNPLDAIIRIGLSSIHFASQAQFEEARAKLLIRKFVLSTLNQDIISFQPPKPKSKRSSVVSIADILNNDIEIDLEQTKDRRVTIVTRPVKIMFDMKKLDEALGSFGGFSGVLELGSSMTSNPIVNSPKTSVAKSRPRGVHFGDTPPPPPPATTALSFPKIQIKFGEVTFTLKGKSCTLQLQTTSVRIAVRESNFRLKVSEVQLSGPYVDAAQVGVPLLVEIRDTTINFLFTPEEIDLTRLISMITPSKDPYENDGDILIDTLLRQRRKGSVLRAEVASVGIRITDIGQLQTLDALGAEVARLARVTKYLPDDDRPGILTLAIVQRFDANCMVNERLGDVSIGCEVISVAHVGVPPLFAVEIGKASVTRANELLIHEVVELRPQDQLPMVMARMIGDEMEPIIKAKLFNLCAEYHVTTIMAALGILDDGTVDDIALGLASSVATITGGTSPKMLSRHSSESSSSPGGSTKPFRVDLLLRCCAIGLNPRKIPSKGLFVLTDAHFTGTVSKKEEIFAAVELRKASIHAIDDTGRLEQNRDYVSAPPASSPLGQHQLTNLRESGYVSLSSISAAKVQVKIKGDSKDEPQVVDVEFKNELFVLESCADSTQTLIAILSGLQPPIPPSTAQQYRTVVPLQKMMESFTGDAITSPETVEEENFMDYADLVADEVPTNLEFVGSFYNPESIPTEEELGDSMLGEDDLGALATPPVTRKTGERGLLESFQEQYEVTEGEQDFDFDDNYFKDSDSEHKGTARKWDSTQNQYHLTNEFKTPDAPLKVCVRDVNIIWNLFDGYDWPRTRGVIAQAVEDVEARAEERRRRLKDEDDEEDFVEADFLFNSVWIGVPVKEEKGALAKKINHDIDDLASETGSYATSTATRSTGATARPRSAGNPHRRRLKLERSKHKKIAFQLSGVALDLIVFPPNSGETQNSLNVRVRDFEIYDHVPSSTWRKFATSLIEPNLREMGKPMINLELLTVRPATVLPLRLHVDQDALDFITRFFEFKDDSAPNSSASSEQPFIQRLEVLSVTLKLDYKPKRVDYHGLRSGHTTEFMNFLILDGADIILRHAIVYGITSFDKLHKTLNDVWMPDVKRNQLPGVLSGLAAVRPIVNVGSGVRDLVVVPMREYRKDGRIVRSLQKGVYAFAKNTTSEAARLGAKIAIGTQNILEGAENFLNPHSGSPRSPSTIHDWADVDPSDASDDEPRVVSNYANQPIGVKAGLRNAARYLERDLLTARDAIIAIPAEVMEEGTGLGMAKAIAKRAPTVILRPALGATKAVSHTLLGVGNALDKDSKRKIEDKYKSY
ncbi:uncharacterized protein BDR25DRAFT_314163 [Lindgomyces ingoldianus]|uniref:Uncharacterized protein n=1 Tax=Lindgomyces ingoldianus TaxID=673940 RepID=A0ACB6QXR7_9PLEO|nr:uncharacterized protein BDR25DRAFT_314163 [Lindgomyces ingoldianus]KAF2470991.1 hypothetical protein BDR25DRAFT_314163 [Lindgomyces ingoldianus]